MLFSPVAMHIPDGFLSPLVWLLCWILSIPVLSYALKRVEIDLGERQLPVIGVLSATIFAGQMLNFPVIGGTSGHLLGAALATILTGPWAGMLIMTSVISIQALIFQDGGLLVLGANVFNMAIVGVSVSYFAYRTALRLFQVKASEKAWVLPVSGFIAGWLSVFVAALSCALQLVFSGTSSADIVIPAMGGIHSLIGIGEGLITAGALVFLRAARHDLLASDKSNRSREFRGVWVGGFLLALLLAVLSPLASSSPDGLEWVAERLGFLERAREPLYQVIPDYVMPGIAYSSLATIIAGITGVVLVGGITSVIVLMRTRGSRRMALDDHNA